MSRHDGKVLAVLGASVFQAPLITRAKELGCEVHAFATPCSDAGEELADVFHPVSTAERGTVLRLCQEINADGIVTIGSDFNNVVATWVANQMGLPANSDECARLSSDKRAMRAAFERSGDPSPKSIPIPVDSPAANLIRSLKLPVIVKPSDRSGSRGITKLSDLGGLDVAIVRAQRESLAGIALVEEFLEGDEFSVEGFSWKGVHRILQITRKYTTGSPHFIETAHLQPPLLTNDTFERIALVVTHALDTLGVIQGASHAEVKVDANGDIGIVEIGSRMGGDFIGSDLVPLSTGVDYVGAVVDAALGCEPDIKPHHKPRASAVRFVTSSADAEVLARLEPTNPELIIRSSWEYPKGRNVVDSSTRFGYCIMAAMEVDDLIPWLPTMGK